MARRESDETRDARELTGDKRIACPKCGDEFPVYSAAFAERLRSVGCTSCVLARVKRK